MIRFCIVHYSVVALGVAFSPTCWCRALAAGAVRLDNPPDRWLEQLQYREDIELLAGALAASETAA